ncbi:MAG TPA: hypothetical protein VFE90_07325 [Myxococcales bacterium]|nr:hypothetical protein [Myxococcales bacterium]
MTFACFVIVKSQVGPSPAQSPDQPLKIESGPAAALVSVTVDPGAAWAVHVPAAQVKSVLPPLVAMTLPWA